MPLMTDIYEGGESVEKNRQNINNRPSNRYQNQHSGYNGSQQRSRNGSFSYEEQQNHRVHSSKIGSRRFLTSELSSASENDSIVVTQQPNNNKYDFFDSQSKQQIGNENSILTNEQRHSVNTFKGISFPHFLKF